MKEFKQNNIEEEIKAVSDIFIYNLKMLHASVELTQTEFSLKIGISSKRIRDIEQGKIAPTFNYLIRIVDFFPITFDSLLESKIELKYHNQ